MRCSGCRQCLLDRVRHHLWCVGWIAGFVIIEDLFELLFVEEAEEVRMIGRPHLLPLSQRIIHAHAVVKHIGDSIDEACAILTVMAMEVNCFAVLLSLFYDTLEMIYVG